MLLGGDEIGRTQSGNNNAYCQDNEISWIRWDLDGDGEALLDFTPGVIELRADHPVFRRTTFFAGHDADGPRLPDVLVVPPRRPADDTSRVGRRADLAASACS